VLLSGKMADVSFDVFLQGFENGEAGDFGAEEAVATLSPHITDREGDSAKVTTADGSADVYGPSTGRNSMMFNHIDGREAWDVIYEVALAANWVVMPVGCGTLLTDEAQRGHLPDGVRADQCHPVRRRNPRVDHRGLS